MVTFNFSYQSANESGLAVTLDQMIAFETAGRIWSHYLTDDVTVNVHVGVASDLPTNVIGGALPAILSNEVYSIYKEQLHHNKTSQDDDISLQYMHNNVIAEGLQVWDDGEVNLTTANAKAVNLVNAQNSALDGVILLSDLSNLTVNQDSLSWNDVSWTATGSDMASSSNTLDMVSVALHELGHILGFVSGVDDAGWFQEVSDLHRQIQDGTVRTQIWDSWLAPLIVAWGVWDFGKDSRMMPLDYFRYSDDSAFWGANDLSTGGDAYFSIDGGRTSLADFSTSKYGDGDGYQASHWKNADDAKGIMNPTLSVNESNTISALDLRAFDVIGWDLDNSVFGKNGVVNDYRIEQTLDLTQSSTLINLWNASQSYVQQNQSRLMGDRTDDVFQMIEDSEVYERRRRKSGGNNGSWQELWQEITDVFTQEASFSTFNPDSISSGLEEQSIPVNSVIPAHSTIQPDAELSSQSSSFEKESSLPDLFRGSKASDDLLGDSGEDRLNGRQGEDRVIGRDGDDLLRGGNHRDVLRGGAGADIFVIQDKHGFDVVRDFTDGEDKLKLGGQLSFDQLIFTQKGDHTLIGTNDTRLMVLRNVDPQLITSSDFI